MNKTKVHKIFSMLLKTAVLLLSLGYVFYKIFYNPEINTIGTTFDLAYEQESFLWYIMVVFLLMPVNWIIETIKWRYLILKLGNISFYQALKAVLVGITFSSFTPNRVGDYFGRAFMLEEADKRSGFLITIVGSIAQTIVTVVIGTIGLIWMVNIFPDIRYTSSFSIKVFLLIILLFNFLILFFYFKISILNNWIKKAKWLQKITPYFEVLSSYSFGELLFVLLLSLLRYMVFVFQFYLLLLVFNIPVSLFAGMAVISVIYLVTTVIPTIALTELGVKSAASIYFFEVYFKNTSYLNNVAIGVVAAAFVLWIINLVIPSVSGSFFVFKMKPFKEKK